MITYPRSLYFHFIYENYVKSQLNPYYLILRRLEYDFNIK